MLDFEKFQAIGFALYVCSSLESNGLIMEYLPFYTHQTIKVQKREQNYKLKVKDLFYVK
jgi:hypothetical protein